MKREFNFEFEDESNSSTISFEYDEKIEEILSVQLESGVPVVYGNKQAFLLLAKTLVKMSMCDYPDGFHLHLNEDFDADSTEVIRLVLNKK